MKKLFYSLVILACVVLVSCQKEPIGGTATQDMSGQWYVTVAAIDDDGEILYEDEDLYGIGNFWVVTYNTSSNTTDSLYIQDVDGALWEFRVKIACDLANLTFENPNGVCELNGEDVVVTNGQILKNAALTPSGLLADSITFDISFSDDPYMAQGYWAGYRVSGYRYTGLANDD